MPYSSSARFWNIGAAEHVFDQELHLWSYKYFIQLFLTNLVIESFCNSLLYSSSARFWNLGAADQIFDQEHFKRPCKFFIQLFLTNLVIESFVTHYHTLAAPDFEILALLSTSLKETSPTVLQILYTTFLNKLSHWKLSKSMYAASDFKSWRCWNWNR